MRLSFESARAGFLYVIDREQYADGTASDPYLIFPTSRTRGGDNRVEAGRLVEVPDQADRPNYFSVRRSRPDQVAEALTVIVAPTPIEGLAPSSGARQLAAADVARWESEWGGAVEQFALEGGAAKPWTTPEQRAGLDASRLLTQDDPPPQTVFRLKSAPGAPGPGHRAATLRCGRATTLIGSGAVRASRACARCRTDRRSRTTRLPANTISTTFSLCTARPVSSVSVATTFLVAVSMTSPVDG